jgi:hypothetical protein
MVESGHLRQRVRAQLVDQAVRKDRIRTKQDNLGLRQALEERHINAVINRNAVSQQRRSLETTIVRWPGLAEKNTAEVPVAVGMVQGGNHRGAVGIGEHDRLRWEDGQRLLAEGGSTLPGVLSKGGHGLAQLLPGCSGCEPLRARLERGVGQVDQGCHGGLRGYEGLDERLKNLAKVLRVVLGGLGRKSFQDINGQLEQR